ncbi:MAG: hypothetical protein LIO77_10915 [Rikenellaceae bacterium]|nr:hypothetical protein [Rikenellaceae bacterium]
MGLAGLFEITGFRRQDGQWVFDIRIDPAHEVFGGHFPGMPVMPGVCSMYIIRGCAAQACGRKLAYDTVKECKFVSSVLPARHSRLKVVLSIGESAAGVDISGTMACGDETMVKIKANLK